MALFGALLLVSMVVVYLLQPIVQGKSALMQRDYDETTEAEARRRIALLALRDAEFDYHTGKLDQADYSELKSRLAAEALEAIRQVEGVDEADLEAEIRKVREGLREGRACGSCGHLNPAGSKFCAACGTALAARETAGSA